MKVIINNCYGGFGVKDEVSKQLGYRGYFCSFEYDLRTDERLIDMAERGEDVFMSYCEPIIANVPDEATDWWVTEYDGLEDLWYVLDGKHVMWEPEDDEEGL